jgi:zinc-dependent metalloproteinase lipoprotein
MKLKTYIFAFLAALFLLGCSSDDDVQTVQTEDTATDEDEDLTTETIDDSYQYKLPVIFHVLYTDETTTRMNIPATRLQTLLGYVNEIYEGGIYGESENIGLKFVLAQYDENGDKISTPGVEYVKWNGDFPIDENELMSDNTGKYTSYLWDPNDYINVLVYPFESSDEGVTLGISHLPFVIKSDSALQGLNETTATYVPKSAVKFAYCSSINSDYVGQSSTGGYYQSDRYTRSDHQATYLNTADIVITIAHELGHYLGLHHVFTEEATESGLAVVDSCGDTDYCDDTPTYNKLEYDSYLEYYIKEHSDEYNATELLKRNNCDGEEFNSVNILDYSITLGYQISADQKKRIRTVLYYSPLIPGPKKNNANVATRASEQPIHLKPLFVK